ncbi:hybrid sensor histidine kinase/response regulator transcription factor [Flammeovirga sp. SubArs3]|uniref:hybrid sensor histidine kinase/response regulator transcription factor n=1 Tax=Flammeovirga sp. SubArs3 TaxID=2995316 RepID=UPI00248CB159|nr:hybrid sensor histidine kinase/response regulator transcription factor [Flammeovirga sp. SubArs3]
MNRFILLFILLCFQISVFGTIKNTRFDRLYDIHGLNQNTVASLHQDKSGFIWIGTPNGLFRYNGNEFKSYIHQPEDDNTLISSSVTNIFEDKNEHLWLITSSGLSIFDLNKEKFYNPEDFNNSLRPKEEILKIEPLNKEELYLLSSDKLYHITIKEDYKLEWKEIAELQRPHLQFRNFAVNKEKVYLQTPITLEVYDIQSDDTIKKLYEIKCDIDLQSDRISAFTINPYDDKLYLSTKYSCFEYELNWEKIKLVNKIDSETLGTTNNEEHTIKRLSLDRNGILWIYMLTDGVIAFDIKSKKVIHFKNSLDETSISSNIVNDILLDLSGLYWFGTGHGAISILNPNKKPFYHISNNYYKPQSLSSNLVNTIYIDKKQKLWVGTFDKGLDISTSKYVLEDSEQASFKNFFKDQTISTIKEFDDKIYVTTSTGLYISDSNHSNFQRIFPQKFPNNEKNFFVELFEKIDDKLLVYAYGRFTMIDINTHEVVKMHNKIKNMDLLEKKTVIQMHYDGKDGVYIGTVKGLYYLKINSGSYEVAEALTPKSTSLSKSRIFVLHKPKNEDNTLWVGTFGDGLYKCTIQRGKVVDYELFSQKDGLPDNVIYSIVEGTGNSLWISSDGGIAKLNPETREVKVYDVSDGLLANNFRRYAFFKMEDGTILMGNLRGITAFNPLDIKDDTNVPRPQILKLKIRNEEINPFQEYDGYTLLTNPIYKTDEITIPYTLNQITLEFGATQYNAKNSIRFSYRLLGVDKQWINADKFQQSANYVKLPSGEYTFELKGYNTDGIEGKEIKRLKIKVLKPWYLTNLAYVIYLAIVIAIILGVIFYLRYLFGLKQSILSEKKDKEHIREINEAKLKFFTNISHELRTPLTLILSPLEKLTYDKKLPPELKEYVENINTNGQRLLNLTNSLIDFRKIGEGEMKIYPVFHDVVPFVTKTAEAFSDYAEDKNIDYQIDIRHIPINGWIDKGTMERILFNLLSNAFKYTPKGGKVVFTIDKIGDELQLKVSDNGVGMDKEEADKIFDRFYRGDNEETLFGSSGIGLNLVQQLLKLHHGEIHVDSAKGRGSTFTVKLPLLHPEFNKTNMERGQIEEANTPPSEVKEETIKSKHTLLIVDDNTEILKLIKDLFHHEYNVHTAENGIEGLELSMKTTPDVILLDVNMPKMNGYELAEKLKENVQTSHVPIIFLTAMSDLESRKKALEKGGQLHIGKPFSPYLLELQVNNIINQKNKEKEILKKNIIMSADKEKVLTKDEQFLKDIKQILEDNYNNDEFTVEELSVKVNMSYIQFYRKFKTVTGITANEYLRLYRLEKASHLLSNDENITVREVMYNVGFNSQSYFTKAFKKEYGLTPAEFKKTKTKEKENV